MERASISSREYDVIIACELFALFTTLIYFTDDNASILRSFIALGRCLQGGGDFALRNKFRCGLARHIVAEIGCSFKAFPS